MARFIQGDRPEAGPELAMTGWKLVRLFLGVAYARFSSMRRSQPPTPRRLVADRFRVSWKIRIERSRLRRRPHSKEDVVIPFRPFECTIGFVRESTVRDPRRSRSRPVRCRD